MITYQQLVEQYLSLITRDPNACVSLGSDQRLDELPDPALSAIKATAEAARQLLAAAESAPGDWAAEQQLDVELIRLSAKRELQHCTLEINGKLELSQRPMAGEEISGGIFLLLVNDPRPAHQRLANIQARIGHVPHYLATLLERLDTPVKRWVEIDVETIEGLDELFETILNWAKDEDYPEVSTLAANIAAAKTAMGTYVEQLRALPTTDNFCIGSEIARQYVANNGIEMSLDEIHQVAIDFFNRTRTELEGLRERLCRKYQLPEATTVAELQAWLNKEYAVEVKDGNLESILDRYQQERQRILTFIQERKLFPVLDDQDMQIIRTPNFMAPMIPAGAMMPPPPLRPGRRTSMVYLTLSEALLDEHTELGIPLMMIHEGIPGHHLQLATASIHASMVRRTFSANEHAEGWTTMLEDYMLEQGYMGDLTDEARFGAKLDISRIGARVAIDLYFMTGEARYLDVGFDIDTSDDDVFVNAGRLLKAVTGFTDARIRGELNWYSQERGYPLSYLVGNHLVWQLKADIAAAQPEGHDALELDRRFHDIYLHSGNMPVALLRSVCERQGML